MLIIMYLLFQTLPKLSEKMVVDSDILRTIIIMNIQKVLILYEFGFCFVGLTSYNQKCSTGITVQY